MDVIAPAQRMIADLHNLNCSSADIAQYVELGVDSIEQLIAGNAVDVTPRTLHRLERLHRLRHARHCVAELVRFGVREKEIASKVSVRKGTITHICRDPYWSVSAGLLDRLKATLSKRRLELFELLLPSLEIRPFQTSGQPTNRRGWGRRAERVRGALLNAYGGSPLTLRGRDFEGIISTIGESEEMILIWAKDARTLLHEANHLVAYAEQKLKRSSKGRTKNKELMRICK